MTITAKIQIRTSECQKQVLNETMSAYRGACNFVSDYIFNTHVLKFASLNKELYHAVRTRFGLKSQMTQSVIKTVVARYKAILEMQHEWIKVEFKHPQYDLVWNRDYSLKQDGFSVNTIYGRIQLPYITKGTEKYFNRELYKFGTAKLVCKNGKYYLHISVVFTVPKTEISDTAHIVGIDRGINFVIATYDSNGKSEFVSGRQIKQTRAKYSALRKQLQKRQTASARRRLKKLGGRENRWMNDLNHCISKALVTKNPQKTLFVLEDLSNVKKATERVRRKDRYVSVSWSFYDLEQKLAYKAKMNQSNVIKVDPRFTSQRCPICGYVDKRNRNKKSHLFTCGQCNYKSNDDRIGAMNLYRIGADHVIGNQLPSTVAI